jgi:D-alanyl-D-alanine carboxypeptidase
MGTSSLNRTRPLPIKTGQIACAIAFALAAATPINSWAAPKTTKQKPASTLVKADLGTAVHVCLLDSAAQICTPVAGLNRNDTREAAPASLNKMMTAYLLYQHMRKEHHALDDVFAAITQQDRDEGIGTRRGGILRQVPTNTPLTYREFFHALTVKSANDAAVRVAKEIAGSETAFATLMTETAQQIGLKETTFRNASGMPAAGQRTTAHDMSLLMARVKQTIGSEEMFRALFGQADTIIAGHEVKGHIPWLRHADNGVIGAKTGTINGVSNITTLTQVGNQLMAITVMAPSAKVRKNVFDTLLKKLSASFSQMAAPALPSALNTATMRQAGLCTGWEDVPELLTSLGVQSRLAPLLLPDGQM